MTFTYSATSLTTDLAKVRSRIGDVEDFTSTWESLHDEEINEVLSEYPQVDQAAVVACERLIARMRRKVSRSSGSSSSSQNEKIENLVSLLDELRKRARKGAALTPYVGTISQDRLDSASEDDDYIAPQFKIGMDDY